MLYGAARVHYTDTKRGIDTVEDLHVAVPFSDGAVPIDWERAEPSDATPEDLAGAPPASAAARTIGRCRLPASTPSAMPPGPRTSSSGCCAPSA